MLDACNFSRDTCNMKVWELLSCNNVLFPWTKLNAFLAQILWLFSLLCFIIGWHYGVMFLFQKHFLISQKLISFCLLLLLIISCNVTVIFHSSTKQCNDKNHKILKQQNHKIFTHLNIKKQLNALMEKTCHLFNSEINNIYRKNEYLFLNKLIISGINQKINHRK